MTSPAPDGNAAPQGGNDEGPDDAPANGVPDDKLPAPATDAAADAENDDVSVSFGGS